MKRTATTQVKRTNITLAAAVAFAVLGTGTALAAPPTGVPTFASADISIEPRGEEAGGLTCSWRETGLLPIQVVTYSCEAGAVGVVTGCVYHNKLVAGLPTELATFQDVTGEGHEGVAFLSKNNGAINGSTTTAIPEAGHGGGEGGELCVEPMVEEVLAVRWCNASLWDTTNNLQGAQVDELFLEFTSGGAAVPSCAELLPAP